MQAIRDKVKHPGRRSYMFLIFATVGGIGSWMVVAGGAEQAFSFAGLGGLLGIISSLGLAWAGETPIKFNK